MKQKKDYQSLDIAELQTKQKNFEKELLVCKLSMDTTAVTLASNLQNIQRDLKIIKRLVAQKSNVLLEAGE